MAMETYIPTFKFTVKAAIAIVIIMVILKYAPIPPSFRDLFRL